MLGAALGVRREQREELAALSESVGFLVAVYEEGRLMEEYQTVETPIGATAREARTRKQELEGGFKTTQVQTYREYLVDAYARVGVWSKEEYHPLEKLKAALEEPEWGVYLGRKAHPPALPFAPEVVHADTVRGALEAYEAKVGLPRFVVPARVRVHWERGVEGGLEERYTRSRRDRRRHTAGRARVFGRRDEEVAFWERE
jgi:CRISPR system Cascade subunit CasD